MDEALQESVMALEALLRQEPTIDRAVLISDLFGQLRVAVWAGEAARDAIKHKIADVLKKAAGVYWTEEIWFAEQSESDSAIAEMAWEGGRVIEGSDRVRLLQRLRRNSAWTKDPSKPVWPLKDGDHAGGPPIIVFYSFKGGVGRSTALASFAVQRARKGERVVVLDLDLDAPGVGVLLASDDAGTIARWGVTDYFLERQMGGNDLRDYYHACRREKVTGSGEILVIPAGQTDEHYLSKLARVDFELPDEAGTVHPLFAILEEVRSQLAPHWILLDARAGLSEPAGLLLSGLAHLYVLFGTSSEQSWQGLRLVLKHLGAERVLENKAQIDCLLVQAMVPEDPRASNTAKGFFSDRARDEFSTNYYSQDPDDPNEDSLWYVRDLDDEDAPHAPVPISYKAALSHFERIDDIASILADSPEYVFLAKRIADRFADAGE